MELIPRSELVEAEIDEDGSLRIEQTNQYCENDVIVIGKDDIERFMIGLRRVVEEAANG